MPRSTSMRAAILVTSFDEDQTGAIVSYVQGEDLSSLMYPPQRSRTVEPLWLMQMDASSSFPLLGLL